MIQDDDEKADAYDVIKHGVDKGQRTDPDGSESTTVKVSVIDGVTTLSPNNNDWTENVNYMYSDKNGYAQPESIESVQTKL